MIYKHDLQDLQEDGCDKGAHQPYLGAERNTVVNPNWFSLVNAAVACAILESISGLEPSSGSKLCMECINY